MAKLITCRLLCAIGLCLGLTVLTACSSFGTRARHAATAAVSDPWTWGPLAGAAVIAATESDERISHWAKTTTPVYGSSEAALDASNRFRSYASSSAWAIFLTATTPDKDHWFSEKGMDASESLVGLAFARATTGTLKSTAQRERPNHNVVRDSFPSAHATDAFAHATLARNYANDLNTYRPLREGIEWASDGFAIATAWGRVEGGVHYPTDVLIGAVVANFTTRFFMKLVPNNAKSHWRLRTRTDENGKVFLQIEKAL